jgi:hypothetical protein
LPSPSFLIQNKTMACDLLSSGRATPCKDVVGGIHKITFINYGDIDSTDFAFSSDEITDISATFTAYVYEVKGNSSFEQSFNSSRENGTTFFTQTLNLTLPKLSKEDNKQLKLMAYGRPQVVVQDYNGNAFFMGLNYGAEVTGGTIVTGAAMGDLSGYTLTLEAQEQLPANFISGATVADPFAGLTSASVTLDLN